MMHLLLRKYSTISLSFLNDGTGVIAVGDDGVVSGALGFSFSAGSILSGVFGLEDDDVSDGGGTGAAKVFSKRCLFKSRKCAGSISSHASNTSVLDRRR